MYETTLIPFDELITGQYPHVRLNQLVVAFGQAVVHDLMQVKQTLDFSMLSNPDFGIPEDTDPLCQIIVLETQIVIYYFPCTASTVDNETSGTTTITITADESYTFVNDTEWSIHQGPFSDVYETSAIVERRAIFPLVSVSQPDDDGESLVPINKVTSFLDLSFIYGSTNEVNLKLRVNDGSGKLLTSDEGDVPFNDVGVPNECGEFDPDTDPNSASGDSRVDVSPALTAVHSLYFRSHNDDAEWVSANHPELTTDEEIFQAARTINIARYQRHVYEEYLPAIFGASNVRRIIGRYEGYDSNADPRIDVAVDIALRILHSQVMMPFSFFDEECNQVKIDGTLGFPLHSRPNCIFTVFRQLGTVNVLKSIITQSAQEMNGKVTDMLRNVVFRSGHNQGTPPLNLDIEMLNIFRGRELGVQNFDQLRALRIGRSAYDRNRCKKEDEIDHISCFLSITRNHTLAGLLRDVYEKVDKVDTFIGLILERKDSSRNVGATTSEVVLSQMKRTRDADPFFYLNVGNLGLSIKGYNRSVETLSDTITRLFGFDAGNSAFEIPTGQGYCGF
jgi:hypothetical protein